MFLTHILGNSDDEPRLGSLILLYPSSHSNQAHLPSKQAEAERINLPQTIVSLSSSKAYDVFDLTAGSTSACRTESLPPFRTSRSDKDDLGKHSTFLFPIFTEGGEKIYGICFLRLL